MLQNVGENILREIREYFDSGYKSSDKLYRIDTTRLHDNAYFRKIHRRNANRNYALQLMNYVEALAMLPEHESEGTILVVYAVNLSQKARV